MEWFIELERSGWLVTLATMVIIAAVAVFGGSFFKFMVALSVSSQGVY